LLDLPRLDADSLSDSGQEQVQRLLKRVAAMLLSKEQELLPPTVPSTADA